ncbi:zinc finger translocation-associated protein isoform 2-T2 [Syngnathus typhle]
MWETRRSTHVSVQYPFGSNHHQTLAEDALANGHASRDESEEGSAGPVRSPGTSYWSISESPDRPLILSPAPGPSSGRKVRRASRPGLSRIPGRDHRRYYHEYWRSEYLMDFDPLRHGMICMVCGSSLATLKLSTIKRHIRQKHPDSLLWSAADKEVIRSGWESHLSLAAPPVQASPRGEREADAAAAPAESQLQQRRNLFPRPEAGDAGHAEDEAAAAAAAEIRTLECYLNASLHAWFRQEFLMEYEADAGRLLCMLCGGQLPSLHLDHIKSHVLQRHPDSLVYTSQQKHCVLQAWAQAHDESEGSIQSEADDGGERDPSPSGDAGPLGQDGGPDAVRPCPARMERRRGACGESWQLRLDYLVAYGPRGRRVYCMVCSQVLRGTQVRSFRRHIQQCHPQTLSLSQEEREAAAAAWTKEYCADGILAQDGGWVGELAEPILCQGPENENDLQKCPKKINTSDAAAVPTADEAPNEDTKCSVKEEEEEKGEDGGVKDTSKDAAPRHGHYAGKDQRRNYQVRWRRDFLMDYDCRRHGLICMVCGAALATLKVSTIKRHIQQVHAHSLRYGDAERRRAALSYDRNAKSFVHADDCFLSRDHARTDTGHFAT